MKARIVSTGKVDKALSIEIKKQFVEYNAKNENEIDAMVLYILHREFKFGPQRLRKFYDSFRSRYQELLSRYESPDDIYYVCTKCLKEEVGIDIEEWNKN